MSSRVRVGVLLSGGGTNLQALIDAAEDQGYPAEIALVISNRRDAGGLERAERAGIPTEWISHRGRSREDLDRALIAALQARGCTWVALAGFMRIVTPVLLDAFSGQVLNIHPALLPAFPGLHAQAQAFDAGVQIAGATVHLVDAGMDTGPIIAQAAVPRLAGDTLEDLQARILKAEHRLYPKVLRWAAEGRISLGRTGLSVDLPRGETRFSFDECPG